MDEVDCLVDDGLVEELSCIAERVSDWLDVVDTPPFEAEKVELEEVVVRRDVVVAEGFSVTIPAGVDVCATDEARLDAGVITVVESVLRDLMAEED